MPRKPRVLQPIVVGPREAAQLLNESLDKIYDKINRGELRSYKDGRLTRIKFADIVALVDGKLAEQSEGAR